jgi:hypothetical protein
MKLLIATMAFLLTACNAQPGNPPKDTPAYKPGKHHFKFTDQGMYYNGTQFRLGDSIQAYVKIFGPYNRIANFDGYLWDSLGMCIKTPAPYRPRVAGITWQISYPQNIGKEYNTFNDYPGYPRTLIPESLDVEKCDIILTKNIRFKEVLQHTDCFYEDALHGLYKTTGYYEPDTSKYYDHIYYYLNSEIYDQAEGKTPYAVVSEFSVETDKVIFPKN